MMNTRVSRLMTLCLVAALGSTVPAEPIRVVILSGQNVHDWKATTPFLEKMYADSGKFTLIDTVNDVSKVTAGTFAKCDVVVSNWTCHPQMTGGPWTAEGQKALTDAIKSGKGMVSFHAACAACNDWADFQQISGLTWKLDHTNHTQYHTFKVVIRDQSHPITAGMPDFWITDELYQRMVKMTQADYHTLADAWAEPQFGGVSSHEPMLITTQLGKGRGVNLLLGHDVHAMSNTAFPTTMLRSTEWAATGKVTIPIPEDWPNCAAAAVAVGVDADAAIQAATTYALGQAYAPLYMVEQLVIASDSRTGKTAVADRARLAARIANAIGECKTAEAKSFFCKQLASIGTAEQVPVIAPLLLDEATNMMARFALERIPAPAAATALRDALGKATGPVKIGLVNSLGNRADSASLTAMESLIRDADSSLSEAAIAAIGKIGTTKAAEVLRIAREKATDPTRPAITDACLVCAERLLAAGDVKNAEGIYRLLYAPAEPSPTRAAALKGLVFANPSAAAGLLKESLTSNVPELQKMAVFLVHTQSNCGGAEPKVDVVALAAEILNTATTPDQKQPALALLADQASLPALRLAVSALKDTVLADDAGRVAARIASSLSPAERDEVRQAMKAVVAASKSPEVREVAGGVLRRILRPVNLARDAQASSPDNIESDGAASGDQAAIDGNAATYWDETDGQKLYILKLTWKQPIACNAIVIAGYAFESFCPREFDIACDGKVVKHVANAVYDPEHVESFFEFPRTTCGSLELRITGYYGGSPAIRELEVYDIKPEEVVAQPAGPPAFKWQQGEATVALLNHDRPVWQFNYARDNGYPYFNPVNLVDGTELVWLSPPDHLHHRALWFAWKMLNGLNYWEHVPEGGVTEVTAAKVTTNPDFSARIDLGLSYHPRNQPPVLTEKRVITISRPAADGSYSMDWCATFTAAKADVEMQGGTAGGGYAGLSVRIAKEAGDWLLINSEGARIDKPPADGFPKGIHGERARWADFSFVSTLTGSPAGIAILDHPSNLRYPSQWHDCMFWDSRFGYFSPAPLWSQPCTLPAGQELTLRYRILLHAGRPETARMDKEFKSFSDAK